MQSRLAVAAAAAAKFNRLVFPSVGKKFPAQSLGFATSTGRTADPAEHAVEPEEVYPDDAIQDEKLRHRPEHEPTTDDNHPYVPPKSPNQTSPKLESPAVAPRTSPIQQQKRRRNSSAAADVTCAGLDGSPWPEEDPETDRRTQRAEQERDDREYFEHHKASPLSEIEIADTRKPAGRATDGVERSDESAGKWKGSDGGVWRPEQLDTAEEALRRAAEVFRMNAVRGDPESPHGRVLRQMRGEYW